MAKGCVRVMKYILVGFNVLVFAVGVIAIGLGSWALASENGADELRDLTGSELYREACIVIISGGCVIAVLALLGCCGALFENRILLGIYFVIMLLFLILFVVVAVVGFFFKDDVKDELQKKMRETLLNDYSNDADVTSVWDEVQQRFECCGVSGGIQSTDSWFLWQSSDFFKKQQNTDLLNRHYVPNSCCNSNFDDNLLQTCYKISSKSTQPIQMSADGVTEDNPALFEKGCVDAVEDKIIEHIIPIAVIAVVVLVIMLLCIIFAVFICVEAGRHKQAEGKEAVVHIKA